MTQNPLERCSYVSPNGVRKSRFREIHTTGPVDVVVEVP